MNRSWKLTIAVLLAAFPNSSASPTAPPLDLKGARVLVCATYFDLMNIPAVQRLKAAGAEVGAGDLGALNWDVAKQYHLIITIAQSPPKPEAGKAVAQVLERFVKAGGGALFFRNFYESEQADEYLAPFGASMPWELILDPAHTYRCPTGFRLTYAHTEHVTTKASPAVPLITGSPTTTTHERGAFRGYA
jgi:hypothetical protein